MKKVLFTATVDSHILHFHIPYLKMFKEKGYEVHVATNGTEYIPYCDVKHVIPFERNPIKINNLKAIKKLKKIIDEENFEIIHCHTPMGGVVTRLAAKKARKNGTKVIYTAHGFHFFKGAPIFNWIIFYPVEKWLSRYTDAIITINKEDYELANRKFYAINTYLTNGVGINEERFINRMDSKQRENLRKDLGLNESDFVIVYVAELNKNKNQKMLIDAVSELRKTKPNIKLLLVGKGKCENEYKSYVKKLKLEKSVMLLGYRSDIVNILNISNMGISTSVREGLGLNVIEYLLCGLPVIVTRNRGHISIVEEGVNGYIIDNKDTDALKDKIIYIYENYKNEEKKIKDNYFMVEKFLLNNVIEDMKKIYSESLKEVTNEGK